MKDVTNERLDGPHEAAQARLRGGLGSAATEIEVGDPAAGLAAIRTTVTRRRRRRRAAIGLLSVAVVGGGAVLVIADLDEGTTEVRTAEPDDASDPTSTTEPVVVVSPTSPVETATEQSPATTAPGVAPDSSTDAGWSASGGPQWLVAWKDGFLAAQMAYEPQASPDQLPDEVRALFPQEFLDLFPDGLPPTLDEAYQIVVEAGLDEELQDLMSEHPEIAEALYSVPVEPELQLATTTDGSAWLPVDVDLPTGISEVSQVAAVDDRLVIIGSDVRWQPASPASEFVVASTTDLATWSVQRIATGAPTDLPEPVYAGAWPQSVALQPSGWVIGIDVSLDLQLEQVVPDDVRQQMESAGYGVSYDNAAGSVEVEVFPDGGERQTFTYTFDELGIPPEIAARLQEPGDNFAGWAGTWDDGATPRPADIEPYAQVFPLGEGFLASGPTSRYSADGVTWEPYEGAPERESVAGTIAVAGATVVFTNDQIGEAHVYRVGDDGVWRPVELTELPAAYYPVSNSSVAASNGALVVASMGEPAVPATEIRIERDGRALTIVQDRRTIGYDVVDIATGEVLASERVDLLTADFDENGPYEHWIPDGVGSADAVIVSPDDGTVVFEVDGDALDDAYRDVYDSGPENEVPDSEAWLVATIDGIDWLVEPIGGDAWSNQVALNGTTLLVGGYDHPWETRELGGG